jgi:hypothetical protein
MHLEALDGGPVSKEGAATPIEEAEPDHLVTVIRDEQVLVAFSDAMEGFLCKGFDVLSLRWDRDADRTSRVAHLHPDIYDFFGQLVR